MNSRVQAHPITVPPGDAGHWQAELSLRFGMQVADRKHGERNKTPGHTGKCALLQAHHKGPLYVQRPFYPEGKELAHIYLLHPPGGVVSGDHLEVTLALEKHSAVLCTTPGAARFYRARSDGRLQKQVNHLQVGEHASLEWLPQETLVYRGARAALDTRVELAAGARFMGWEIVALGLKASEQAFDAGEFRQAFLITQQGVPVFAERMQANAKDSEFLQGQAGLAGNTITGSFVCGPFAQGEDLQTGIAQVREIQQERQVKKSVQAKTGMTHLGDFAVLRYLGDCSEEARQLFTQAWEVLRPLLLKRPPCRPRIWST